jgi:hypothetical protein
MNKELRKKIETELSALVSNALLVHHKVAASEISKSIKDHAKAIAKKFVKHLPAKPPVKKAPVKKKSAKKAPATKPKAKKAPRKTKSGTRK